MFSVRRFAAVVVKEFVQMRRDRLTFAMMVGIPIVQLVLFGFAINSDPKSLPTAVLANDNSAFSRSLVRAMENTGYFRVVAVVDKEADIRQMLREGAVQFAVTIPADFSRDVQRGARPRVLVEADATDPAATSNALGALKELQSLALRHDLKGSLAALQGAPPPFEIIIHRAYNPEGITQYNIVPALIGVILTMTMVIMTALAVTREIERGTMENLLSMPVRPAEVLLGKILPYSAVGGVQVVIVMAAARLIFDVPFVGNLWLFGALVVVFVMTNLALGLMFSTVARNQLQAMQMAIFFFLPSILLSGFMFPYRGMPAWAQALGEILPLTHFLRITRGILLKGSGWRDIAPEVWPLLAFFAVVLLIAMRRYRQTLD
ncbi:MAG: ABC transporter permease [Proteobacteria bacterium]|nr:ABC transporter permease [Pseudomonadota bacterium]MDA1057333.1 ABC transporter permease [Pseudomonadota bacterium]